MGMKHLRITWAPNVLLTVIREYTREAGVRELERQISTCLRHIAELHVLSPKRKVFKVTRTHLRTYLGVPPYVETDLWTKPAVGRAVGLAWTSRGGTVLPVEVSLMPGTGRLALTGQLGSVMKESAQAALSLIRSNSRLFGLAPQFYKEQEIHVHVPEGSVPKDGPSAGITLAVAMVSALTKTPVSPRVAFTGELTLSGAVLPIGGLNEKVLAAKRNDVRTIVLPSRNKLELEDLPPELKSDMKFVPASNLGHVLKAAFPKRPKWGRIGA
jgi:ATP-dependent Lon protease